MAATFKCPHCGANLAVVSSESDLLPGAQFDRPATWDHMGDYGAGVALGAMMRQPTATRSDGWQIYRSGPGAATVEKWREIRFEQPARAASVQADVQVPALQAAVTGLFVGAGFFIGALWLTIAKGWAWYIPPSAGALAWLATAGLMWSNLLTDSRALLRKVESYVGRDLDGDGKVGPPETVSIRVEAVEEKGHTTYDILHNRAELARVFTALEAGRIARISRPALMEIGISDHAARVILNELKAGAFIDYPSGPTAGAELTARGRALSRKLARELI